MPGKPHHGRRLLVSRVDELAVSSPSGIWASFPSSSDLRSVEFQDVDWSTLANAVNRVAWWLEATLGGGSDDFDTLAYMGTGGTDIRYVIFMLSANKTGHKMLLPSPRNSLEGQKSLIRNTACKTILHDSSVNVDDLISSLPVRSFVVPDLEDLLNGPHAPAYPFEKSFHEAQNDPYVVLHTSGSTGVPKPVFCPQSLACTVDAYQAAPCLGEDRSVFEGVLCGRCERFFSAMPLFHSAGILLGIATPAFYETTVVFGPAATPVSATWVDKLIDLGSVESIICPPSILEEMEAIPASLERLRKLGSVAYCGGPLSTACGNSLAAKSHIFSIIGSTETFSMLQHDPDPDAWSYNRINSEHSGIEWEKQSGESLYELVFVRKPHLRDIQGIFKTFPHLDRFATGDLFEKHPTKADYWATAGRKDDLICLNNGENVHPRRIEDTLKSHPKINDVLVVGHGYFQLAAILEPRGHVGSREEQAELMDNLWCSVVKRANEISPTHARLIKPLLLLARSDKPFKRVAKGSIARAGTIELYKTDIDRLYGELEVSLATDLPSFNQSSLGTLKAVLWSACEDIMDIKISSEDQDIFSAGADSLRVLSLALTLKKVLAKGGDLNRADGMSTQLIYENPTIRKLAKSLHSMTNCIDENGHKPSKRSKHQNLHKIVEDCTIGLPFARALQPDNVASSGSYSVLLTGSTGSLGSYILGLLSRREHIDTIYCLNRAEDGGRAQQHRSSTRRGLNTQWERVRFVHADLAKHKLGMEDCTFRAMLETVRYIIHSQWPVNFHLPLSSFSSHIQGVSRLAQLSSQTATKAPMIFLSSIASVQNYKSPYAHDNDTSTAKTADVQGCTSVPEFTIATPDACAPTGYAHGKFAAHQVLEYAAAEWDTQSAVIRIGQIAGPVEDHTIPPGELRRQDGPPQNSADPKQEMDNHTPVRASWPQHEWFPILVSAARHLGALPESLGAFDRVDWVPVEHVAETVCDIAEAQTRLQHPARVEYYHVTNPRPVMWQTLLPAFHDTLPVVPLEDWVERLRKKVIAVEGDDTVGRDHLSGLGPAIGLFEFYESMLVGRMPMLELGKSMEVSKALRDVPGVSVEWMEMWLEQMMGGSG